MEPRPWSICLLSFDINLIISHGDNLPAIQTPTSSVTMESTFSLEHFSAIAADLNYILLLGQPLPELLCTAWHIFSKPAPSVPLVLSQHVLLISPLSHTYFGCLKSIVRLENSYLIISVSPESSAYCSFIPESCHIHLPLSFISLPWTCQVHYSCLTSLLSRSKHKWYSALKPFLGVLIEYRTFTLLLKGRLLLGSINFRIFVLQKLNPRVLWHFVTNCYSSRHSRPPDTALLFESILLFPSHPLSSVALLQKLISRFKVQSNTGCAFLLSELHRVTLAHSNSLCCALFIPCWHY